MFYAFLWYEICNAAIYPLGVISRSVRGLELEKLFYSNLELIKQFISGT